MQGRRLDRLPRGSHESRRVLRSLKSLAFLVLAVAAMTDGARAQIITVDVDPWLADYLLEAVCSGEEIDEARLRSSPLARAQVEHHTSFSRARNMDALLDGLRAASRCEVPENDVFRFRAVVEDKAAFEATVDFLRSRASEIEAHVRESVLPYVPQDLRYSGNIALSIVGNPCGGFASGDYVFLALNCLRGNHEQEYSAIKVVSAHELFHALQERFFWPDSTALEDVTTLDDAFALFFHWLMWEGTAEFVSDSRNIDGSGVLAETLSGFADHGYGHIPLYTEFLGYAADMLAAGDDYQHRLKNLYSLGFAGTGRQVFYYAGAAMAGHLERTWGRGTLICIFHLPPEQFVRAYHAAASQSSGQEALPLGDTVTAAANRLSNERDAALRFEGCRNEGSP